MDTRYLEKRMKSIVPDYLWDMSEEYGFFIAGGAINAVFTNGEVNDIDIYIKRDSEIFEFAYELIISSAIVSVTDKSILLMKDKTLVNVILLDSYKTAQDIFDSFDFTCVMGAYDMNKNEFILHDDFLLHNSQRVLRFNTGTKFPIMSAIRVKKYEDKGYTISKNEFLRIILTCCTLDINSYEELSEQIGGMYGIDIEELLDTEKPFDLATAIDDLGEIAMDFDEYHRIFEDNSTKKERFYELIIKLVVKHAGIITKAPFITFSKDGIDEERDYLCINNRLFTLPEYLKGVELPKQTSKIRIYKQVLRTEDAKGEYTYHLDGYKFKMGEFIERESGVWDINPFDKMRGSSFTRKNYKTQEDEYFLLGIFELDVKDCEGFSYDGIKVSGLRLVGATTRKCLSDTHNDLRVVDSVDDLPF